MKLAIIWSLLRAKKFMFLCGNEEIHIVTNYDAKEISRSGNAIYIHKK